MKLFVIVGMPAAGKNIARLYAQAKGIPYVATGDFVREEVRRRNLAPDSNHTAAISDELRGPDGKGVTRLAVDRALQCEAPVVFLEGMRSWPEIELIRSRVACTVIAFVAPRKLRLERVAGRGRPDDSPSGFEDREEREIAYGAAVPIARADEYVLNTSTMEDAWEALDRIIQKSGS